MTTGDRNQQQPTDELYDELYRTYGQPLEATHGGEYLAIAQDGKIVLGATLLEVAQKAAEALGPDTFIFKVGEPAVGKLR